MVAAFLRPDDDFGVAVTDGMPFGALQELGRKLAGQLDPFLRPRGMFESAAGLAKRAMADRNHLLHGYLTGGGREPAVSTLVRAAGEKARTVSDQDVRAAAGPSPISATSCSSSGWS